MLCPLCAGMANLAGSFKGKGPAQNAGPFEFLYYVNFTCLHKTQMASF
jgi:hypothetical protein